MTYRRAVSPAERGLECGPVPPPDAEDVGREKTGPKLEAFRKWAAGNGTPPAPTFIADLHSRGISSPRADAHEAEPEEMNVLPFRAPFARLPRQSDGFPTAPSHRPPAG